MQTQWEFPSLQYCEQNGNPKQAILWLRLTFYIYLPNMGYNSACSDQYCSANCCNYYGSCPDYYSSSSYRNQCWYYYSNSCSSSYSSSYSSSNCCYTSSRGYYACEQTDVGAIVGGVVGAVVGVALLIVLIVCVCRRCRQPPPPAMPVGNGSLTIIQGGGQPVYSMNPVYPPVGPTYPYGSPNYNAAYSPNAYGPAMNMNAPYIAPNQLYPQK